MARSSKKGPFVDLKLRKKVLEAKHSNNNSEIKTWSRSCTVIPEFVGVTFGVHNGKTFTSVYVTESMVGHKLGEFSHTRTFRMHSGQRKDAKVAKK